ncbi:MAG: hypothetical protein KIT25_18130 [Enhydrobacter sp.]|nr:MAG: hypothetical protein KIT25_18130 [Enhydrobacter sp.]
MPIYMEISRLHRLVTIVARGKIGPDEMRGAAQKLFDAQVPEFAKLVDVSWATGEFTQQQIENIAALLRGGPQARRGPVAFLVDPKRGEFARAFKATQGERPVDLFRSLHEARAWLQKVNEQEQLAAKAPYQDNSPWTDPEREAVMFRGTRSRDVAIKSAA